MMSSHKAHFRLTCKGIWKKKSKYPKQGFFLRLAEVVWRSWCIVDNKMQLSEMHKYIMMYMKHETKTSHMCWPMRTLQYFMLPLFSIVWDLNALIQRNVFYEMIMPLAYFSRDWNSSSVTGWIKMECCSKINGPQMMNSNHLGDPLTFHITSSWGWLLCFSVRYLSKNLDYLPRHFMTTSIDNSGRRSIQILK